MEDRYTEKDYVARLIGLCRMYSYASQGSPELRVNPVAREVATFTILHLINTMFIIKDRRNDPIKGVFHRILDPLNRKDLLDEIDDILDTEIDEISLREFIRITRNSLATHGKLTFKLRDHNIEVARMEDDFRESYFELMEKLDIAVRKLDNNLSQIHDSL